MAYGLKYQTQFTSQSDANTPEKDYRLQFLFKDYAGQAVSVTGAATSVVQRCTIDDPFAPIKGQSLDITLINKNGELPITAFQSEDDDAIMVKLLDASDNVLFIGYTVQDDFYETMVDFEHTITLSATDSLGLLKGVILSEARVRRPFVVTYGQNGVEDNIIYILTDDSSFYPQVDDILEVLGASYTIVTALNIDQTILGNPYNWTIQVTPAFPPLANATETIYLTGGLNLYNKNSLLSIIVLCLGETNLSLLLYIYHNLYAYQQDNTVSTFELTLIDTQTFISGDSFMNCYDVLQMIMNTFKCQMIQANGQWNIVAWGELKYYSNAVPGFIYDESLTLLGTTILNNTFNIGPTPQLTRPIYSLTGGSVRGYKFSRKQFNYRQPKYLLKNYDLQDVGDLIRQYVSGATTVYEYVATDWLDSYPFAPYVQRFIRVIKDSDGTEIERALVLKGPTGDTSRAVQSQPIEVNIGDKVKFSFSFQTNNSQTGSLGLVFAVRLTDGVSNYYVDELPVDNGAWGAIGYNYTINGGDNSNILHTVEITSSIAPVNGLLYCYLAQAMLSNAANDETWYRDIRYEYIPYINEQKKITGQVHKQTQPPIIKNNTDIEIQIDDSPRNSIQGTLFLNTKSNLLQDRTTLWRYPPDANGWRLGERTTLIELLWRQRTRSKLEGGFVGNYQQNVISLLTLGITDFNPTKNYTFGLLTIDYKSNQFSGTLWEVYDSEDPELDNTYTLDYIYSTT